MKRPNLELKALPEESNTRLEPVQDALFPIQPLIPEGEGFRAPVAANIAGITYRQLDYWTRGGVVTPEVPGNRRLYSPRNAMELSVIGRLIANCRNLQPIDDMVTATREQLPDSHIITPPLPTLVRDDTGQVRAGTDKQEVLDLLQSTSTWLAISLDGVYKTVYKRLQQLKDAMPHDELARHRSRKAQAAHPASGTRVAGFRVTLPR